MTVAWAEGLLPETILQQTSLRQHVAMVSSHRDWPIGELRFPARLRLKVLKQLLPVCERWRYNILFRSIRAPYQSTGMLELHHTVDPDLSGGLWPAMLTTLGAFRSRLGSGWSTDPSSLPPDGVSGISYSCSEAAG